MDVGSVFILKVITNILFNIMLRIIFTIMLITIIEAISMSCLKEYQMSKNLIYYGIAILLYSIVCGLLVSTYGIEKIGLVNALWSGLSVITVLLFGIIFFKENIHVHDVVATILIIIGIFIIQVTK